MDEVVLSVPRLKPTPRVEIHCHGGAEVVRWLLELLDAQGVQRCSWQELERRFTDDPLEVSARTALAEALTLRTAGILLDQCHGALRRAFAAIEAAEAAGNAEGGSRLREELRRYAPVGLHLTTPWRVAVMGAPNVGKSSLVNALAGYQRTIVSATPGTTRDVVTTLIAVDGWPIELSDTAGFRESSEVLEAEGIKLARTAGQSAELCLWILDAATAPVFPPTDLKNVRLVLNKIDLPAVWDVEQASALRVSAQTGEGMADLVSKLAEWLVPEPPPPGAAVPFTAEIAKMVGATTQ